MSGSVVCFVIVAETLLESRLLKDLHACGATGWTVTDARGRGPRNRRVSEIEGGNVRIETLVSHRVAEAIWEVLEKHYFDHYALAAWTSDVGVSRVDRYSPVFD